MDNGLVPAPLQGQEDYFLCVDGSWKPESREDYFLTTGGFWLLGNTETMFLKGNGFWDYMILD